MFSICKLWHSSLQRKQTHRNERCAQVGSSDSQTIPDRQTHKVNWFPRKMKTNIIDTKKKIRAKIKRVHTHRYIHFGRAHSLNFVSRLFRAHWLACTSKLFAVSWTRRRSTMSMKTTFIDCSPGAAWNFHSSNFSQPKHATNNTMAFGFVDFRLAIFDFYCSVSISISFAENENSKSNLNIALFGRQRIDLIWIILLILLILLDELEEACNRATSCKQQAPKMECIETYWN